MCTRPLAVGQMLKGQRGNRISGICVVLGIHLCGYHKGPKLLPQEFKARMSSCRRGITEGACYWRYADEEEATDKERNLTGPHNVSSFILCIFPSLSKTKLYIFKMPKVVFCQTRTC